MYAKLTHILKHRDNYRSEISGCNVILSVLEILWIFGQTSGGVGGHSVRSEASAFAGYYRKPQSHTLAWGEF